MFEENQPNYATFWERALAYLVDVLLIGSISFALNYLNFESGRSFFVYLLITIPGMLYKPVMESKYGATLGKMLFSLKVVNDDLNSISLEKSFLRSLIILLPALFYIPFQYLAFNDETLMAIDGFLEFTQAMGASYAFLMVFNCMSTILFFTDFIVLLVNDTTTRRSWKDSMAKTYVIKDISV